jgi:hypothetical protein
MADISKDRLHALLDTANTTYNGIDFVEIVTSDQKTLRVHFLNTVTMQGTVTAVAITGGETVPTVTVNPINNATDWSLDANLHPLLTLTVPAPGDFSFYTLTLTSPVLDRFFDHVTFSFKAQCPSDLDCEPALIVCPELPSTAPPIDYLAKDFLSFRKALSDFSALRYPAWQERSEADFGVMFMEALSALADDLSYTQDRVAAEATLDTATQRRSIVRHARLVDYEPRPTVASSVTLQFDVSAASPIPSGLLVSAQVPEAAPIFFETGTSLVDPKTGRLNQASYAAHPLWNRAPGIMPYWWDDSQRCLQAGATEMWVVGHGFHFFMGQTLLLDTASDSTADPHVREIVEIAVTPEEQSDPLFGSPPPTLVTHLVFSAPLQFDHDLTRTKLVGNLAPATQGRRILGETFAIDNPPPANLQMPRAVVRTGPNDTPDAPALQYLYTLHNAPLTWLPQDDPTAPPLPEILLTQELPQSTLWTWRRTLLDAEPFEDAFTLDPVSFLRTARDFSTAPMQDYDGDAGDTIRFGDGLFGGLPDSGDVFQVLYRVGGGAIGNVAADSIMKVEPGAPSWITAVTNPFPASGGADQETTQQVQRLAPQAFRAKQFRAVRPEDYEAAAKTLPWVLRAGTVFRWTGSWLTVFTTADPRGSETIPVAEHTQLIDLLNRYRLAGYESYAPAPRYVALDLYIYVCALPDAFQGNVEAAILKVLSSSTFPDGTVGFFYTDRFTFGMPLERTALEAAIQAVNGVAGVTSIQYRQRGVLPQPVEMPDSVMVAPDQILRVDNDPSRPDRGSLHVEVKGGK